MCVYCGSVSESRTFFFFLHVCVCACEGDEVKGFTLHLSLCVYPFWDPRCKEEAPFHSFFRILMHPIRSVRPR